MTVVIAQIRNDEILIQADTKISDAHQTRPDQMPGRLKIVTLGQRFTVAFAGDADPAHLAVRQAAKCISDNHFAAAIECIEGWSRQRDIDFIVATHQPHAQLRRVSRGVALDILDICSIGDTGPFREYVEAARLSTEEGPLRGGGLRSRFIDKLMTNKGLGDHIGGFPTAVEASSDKHCYLSCSGFYTYKFPNMKWGEETHQSVEEVYSGEGHFQFSIMPLQIEIPIMGVCLLQARTGYVYSPLIQPNARAIKLIDRADWEGHEDEMYNVLRKALNAEAQKLQQAFPGQFVALPRPAPANSII